MPSAKRRARYKQPRVRGAAAGEARVSGVRRGLVEAEILEQAARLFAERGIGATSIKDIADDLGISRPALYHYFRSREDILARLMSGLAESAERAVQTAVEGGDGDPKAKLHRVVAALVAPIAEAPNRFRLLLTSDATVEAELVERMASARRSVVNAVSEVIREGVASGRFRAVDERVATFAVLGMVNWVAWWYRAGEDPSIELLAEQLADLAVDSLAHPDERAADDTSGAVLRNIRGDLDRLEKLLER